MFFGVRFYKGKKKNHIRSRKGRSVLSHWKKEVYSSVVYLILEDVLISVVISWYSIVFYLQSPCNCSWNYEIENSGNIRVDQIFESMIPPSYCRAGT